MLGLVITTDGKMYRKELEKLRVVNIWSMYALYYCQGHSAS